MGRGTVMKDLGKRVGIVICLSFLGLMILPSPGEATPMPSPGNNYGDMRSALKFLQDMDSYYGQIARPRSKKDDCPDDVECDPGWSRFILLQGNDDSVSRLSRPRFGKRSEPGVVVVPNPSEMYTWGGPGGGPVFIRGMPRYYGLA